MGKNPLSILQEYWGYSAFRPLQQEIIESVLQGKDVLALMPTGGGKSICFQVPALVKDGLCLVVTPLISLMRDQVSQLKNRNISAAALHTGMSRREIDLVLENAAQGQYKFLYISPERLQTELMQVRAQRMPINLLAVDEAHCISQWGFDFRPAYRKIAEFRELIGKDVPCLALTATATPQVAQDITEQLAFRPGHTHFQQSFARPNLSYNLRETENKFEKLREILERVPGTAVVYVRSRKRAQELTRYLNSLGLSAAFYHAGLSPQDRSLRQDAWLKNHCRIMVATNAFGMGIDKPDVRLVLHFDMPDSLEAYYQEAGRAGRDGKKSFAVVLLSPPDAERMQAQFVVQYPPPEEIRRVYQALANYYKIAVGSNLDISYDFDFDGFCSTYDLPKASTFHALKRLEEEGHILLTESFYQPSRVHLLIAHQDLYAFQIANAPLEPLIKSLLRLYGGEIFSGFSRISEVEIGKLMKASAAEVRHKLEMLHKREVLEYDAQSNLPQLTFLSQRYEASKLPLQISALRERKEAAENRLRASLDYLGNTSDCRTRQLLAYFGETDYQNCGVCDVCVLARQQETGMEELMERFRREIPEKLKGTSLEMQELMKALQVNHAQQPAFSRCLRMLLDEEQIYYTPSGRIAGKEKKKT
jgi:ATP-dependent DNA helicase RecQ